jgi:hypothetical protein
LRPEKIDGTEVPIRVFRADAQSRALRDAFRPKGLGLLRVFMPADGTDAAIAHTGISALPYWQLEDNVTTAQRQLTVIVLAQSGGCFGRRAADQIRADNQLKTAKSLGLTIPPGVLGLLNAFDQCSLSGVKRTLQRVHLGVTNGHLRCKKFVVPTIPPPLGSKSKLQKITISVLEEQTMPDKPENRAFKLLSSRKTLIRVVADKNGAPNVSYARFVHRAPPLYVYTTRSRHTKNMMETAKASVMFIEDEARTRNFFARKRLTT